MKCRSTVGWNHWETPEQRSSDPGVHGVPSRRRQGFGVPVGDVLAVGGCSGIALGSLAEVNVKGQFIFQMQSRNLSVI